MRQRVRRETKSKSCERSIESERKKEFGGIERETWTQERDREIGRESEREKEVRRYSGSK